MEHLEKRQSLFAVELTVSLQENKGCCSSLF